MLKLKAILLKSPLGFGLKISIPCLAFRGYYFPVGNLVEYSI
jgi:hypothetical protein